MILNSNLPNPKKSPIKWFEIIKNGNPQYRHKTVVRNRRILLGKVRSRTKYRSKKLFVVVLELGGCGKHNGASGVLGKHLYPLSFSTRDAVNRAEENMVCLLVPGIRSNTEIGEKTSVWRDTAQVL